MTIEWRRLARPQADGYDTDVIDDMATRRYGFVKIVPADDDASWLGSTVLLRNDAEQPGPGIVPADLEHHAIGQAEAYLEAWPECFAQAQRLLQIVYAFSWQSASPGARGCICGTVGNSGREDTGPFGVIFSTIFDPVGFVEGVVHEMAHWKLHALGIHFEEWDGDLLLNGFDELFVSSVRKDKKRPMGAVLHAHWVYLHVLASNLAAWSLRPDDHDADLTNIKHNLSRSREGQAEIAANARWTPAGQAFWDGIQEWTDELFRAAEALHV